MSRSTRDAWFEGPGDLAEADVEDVPSPGMTVRVRALNAKFSATVQAQMKLVTEGREQVARIDIAEMEALQFHHGCIDPQFTLREAKTIQERYGRAFRKVVAEIDRISGIDKEAIAETETRFPAGGEDAGRADVADGSAGGNGRPDLPARTGA